MLEILLWRLVTMIVSRVGGIGKKTRSFRLACFAHRVCAGFASSFTDLAGSRKPAQREDSHDDKGADICCWQSRSAPLVSPTSEVTHILSAIEQGDPHAAEQLLPLVYDELRKLAAQKLAQEKPGQTLQATALVHEAYLRLVATPPRDVVSPPRERGQAPNWDSRGHFFAAAAEAMRRILVENARRKKRSKHGGDRQRVDLDSRISFGPEPDDPLALDAALSRLAAEDAPAAELVKLHFFAGLAIEKAGELLGLSRASAYRLWAYARAWLRAEIEGGHQTR
jgi:RNA polymerase sigma factor (TIGR02999 family)